MGFNHTAGLKNDNSLWTWGTNAGGKLGQGPVPYSNIPVNIGTDFDWQTIDAGYSNTSAVATDGSLWICGSNNYGQLGHGLYFGHYKDHLIEIACPTLGIYNNEEFSFSIYPNPTTGIVNVDSLSSISEIEVYNLVGQFILKTENINTVDISALNSGVYFLKIRDSRSNLTIERIIKE